jgi:hypothetical protein
VCDISCSHCGHYQGYGHLMRRFHTELSVRTASIFRPQECAKQQADFCDQVGSCLLLAGCLLSVVFDLEDVDNLCLRNVDKFVADYMASYLHTHGRENFKTMSQLFSILWK